jgi:hypothetical protein
MEEPTHSKKLERPAYTEVDKRTKYILNTTTRRSFLENLDKNKELYRAFIHGFQRNIVEQSS